MRPWAAIVTMCVALLAACDGPPPMSHATRALSSGGAQAPDASR